MAKSAAPEIDAELERTMQMIHDRMEKLLLEENARHQRYATLEKSTSHYR